MMYVFNYGTVVCYVTNLFLVISAQLSFQEGGQICLRRVLFQLEQYECRAASWNNNSSS